jgi:hypothetical protein
MCPSGYCECAGGVQRHPVGCKPGTHGPFKCSDECKDVPVPPSRNSTGLALSNGFITIILNTQNPSISAVYADFLGMGNYSTTNVFGKPYALEVEDASGVHSSVAGVQSAEVTILSNTTELVSVMLSGIVDDAKDPTVKETWVLSLKQGERSYELNTTATVVKDSEVKSIRHAMGFNALSIYGLFNAGGEPD